MNNILISEVNLSKYKSNNVIPFSSKIALFADSVESTETKAKPVLMSIDKTLAFGTFALKIFRRSSSVTLFALTKSDTPFCCG